MGEKTLTASDRLALSRMPDGWFGLHDLPPVVHNPAYRCQRLVERGLLEWEVVGEPHTTLNRNGGKQRGNPMADQVRNEKLMGHKTKKRKPWCKECRKRHYNVCKGLEYPWERYP